ncbi:hypothetical protein RQM65_17920 [Pricia sp. S334]|uniref:Uncharacterized protein n=1 Tax=Pricia mediterranea TaxID=3076079 RepID=A0ABU3LB90_9FLAO|nr:hypothetical protein [Pricia sp. S334]MDT7830551.1 hypothetical protein [Pricia sp. S334]
METKNQTHIVQFIEALKTVVPEELNELQKSFLQLFSNDVPDYKRLNTLLNDRKLYERMSISYIKNMDLTSEDWKAIHRNLLETDEHAVDSEILTESIDFPPPKGNNSTDSTSTPPEDTEPPLRPPTAPLNVIYFTAELNDTMDDINIRFKKPKQAWPSELSLFVADLDKVQNTVNEIYGGKARESLMRSLAGIARVGGTSTFLELAILQLEQFRNELVLRKGDELKHSFLKALGIYSLVVIGSCLLILVLQNFRWVTFNITSMIDPVLFNNGLFILIGASIGAWLSFAIRKKEIVFSDLRILSDNKSGPLIRLIIVLLISICFYFMFLTNFVNIKIGEFFDTSNLLNIDYRNLAFLVGVFLGLSENSIGGKLTSQIDGFISKF